MSSIKELLGVRPQTPYDTVCAESGLLSAQAFVKKRQVDFLKNVRANPDFETLFWIWQYIVAHPRGNI